jgi:hypothetical protein
MRFLIGFAIAVLMLTPFGFSEPPTSFCDLMRNPEKYNGKEVTVRATWRYEFEQSQFYCIDCSLKEMTWLDVWPSKLDDESTKAFHQIPKGHGIVNITVQGTFQSGDHFGHLGAYSYQITVHKISNVSVVSNTTKGIAGEQEAEKRWACGGSNPK